MINGTELCFGVLHLYETVDHAGTQTRQPEVLKTSIGRDDRQCLDVRVLQAADSRIEAKARSVIDVPLNSVAVGGLVHDGVFPPKTLGTGEVESPSEYGLASAVGQEGANASKGVVELEPNMSISRKNL